LCFKPSIVSNAAVICGSFCTLAQFLNFWAVVFIATTVLVLIFKKEAEDKDIEGVVAVYQQMVCSNAINRPRPGLDAPHVAVQRHAPGTDPGV
jgi:hypothetical protein